jgi:DNA-binding response OmpR family regulator
MKILVADDQIAIQQCLRDVLAAQGYDVVTANDGVQALEAYREHRPAFTLTDISMPGMTGLELLRQIKALNAEAVVMLMTGAGTENFAVEALRGGAVNYFNKPVDINELIHTINRYSTLAGGYDYELFASGFILHETLRLQLNNDLTQVNHAVQMIVNHCRAIFALNDLFTLRFGLYEMIVNAIEHGNLGITYEEKSAALEENKLAWLLEERAQEPERASRRVEISCEIMPSGLACTISDEGDGFDHTAYSDLEDPTALFEQIGNSLHGRGIVLTRLQFDEVQFNDLGNQVRLVKRATNPALVGVG